MFRQPIGRKCVFAKKSVKRKEMYFGHLQIKYFDENLDNFLPF